MESSFADLNVYTDALQRIKPWEGAPYAGKLEEEGEVLSLRSPRSGTETGAPSEGEERAGAAGVGKDLGEQFSGATKPGETWGRGPSQNSPDRTLWNRRPVPDASELDPRAHPSASQGPSRGPVSREPQVCDHHPTNTPHLPSRVSSPESGSQELREDLENQTRGQKAETSAAPGLGLGLAPGHRIPADA